MACYTGYLFTNDPEYLTQHGSMEPMYKTQQQQLSEKPSKWNGFLQVAFCRIVLDSSWDTLGCQQVDAPLLTFTPVTPSHS